MRVSILAALVAVTVAGTAFGLIRLHHSDAAQSFRVSIEAGEDADLQITLIKIPTRIGNPKQAYPPLVFLDQSAN